jgi:hypothetical protein
MGYRLGCRSLEGRCVSDPSLQDVKREIDRRRRKQEIERSKVRLPEVAGPEGGADLADPNRVALDDFTAHDRLSVIYKMLSHDQALEALYHQLFPQASHDGIEADDSLPTRQRVSTKARSKPSSFEELEGSPDRAAQALVEETSSPGRIPLNKETIEYLAGQGLGASNKPVQSVRVPAVQAAAERTPDR